MYRTGCKLLSLICGVCSCGIWQSWFNVAYLSKLLITVIENHILFTSWQLIITGEFKLFCTLLIINSTIVVVYSRIYTYHTFWQTVCFSFVILQMYFVSLCTPPASQVAFFCGKSGLNICMKIWTFAGCKSVTSICKTSLGVLFRLFPHGAFTLDVKSVFKWKSRWHPRWHRMLNGW